MSTYNEVQDEWAESPFTTGEQPAQWEAESAEALEEWTESLGEEPFEAEAPGAAACPDTTYQNAKWRVSKPGRHDSPAGRVRRADGPRNASVTWYWLDDFDVDDYRLRPAHKEALQNVVAGLRREAGQGQIAGTVLITVYGQTSSTATQARNIALSRHRAHNTAEFLRCSFAGAGMEKAVEIKAFPLGEALAVASVGQEREAATFRQVMVRVTVPRPVRSVGPPAGPPMRPPIRPPIRPGRPPARPGRPRTVRGMLCVTVLSLRRTGPSTPGPLELSPVQGRVLVRDVANRRSALYLLRGTAIGMPAAAGPIGRLLAMWPAQVQGAASIAGALLAKALGLPDANRCRPAPAIGVGASPARLLSGPVVLTVPARAPFRTLLQLKPRSRRLRLVSPVLRVRWRGRPPTGHVFVVGQLALARVPQREAEFPLSEAESWGGYEEETWSEFGETETWSDFESSEESEVWAEAEEGETWAGESAFEGWGESEAEAWTGEEESAAAFEDEAWPGEVEVGWGSGEYEDGWGAGEAEDGWGSGEWSEQEFEAAPATGP